MKPPPPPLTRAVVLWVISGLLISLGAQLLYEAYGLLAGVAVGAWVVIGLLFLLIRLWEARRAATRRTAFASAGQIVFVGLLVAAVSPFLAQVGARVTESLRFTRLQPIYEKVVAEVEKTSLPRGRHQRGDLVYLVEPGPPLRLAFPWPGATATSWCGAIHDPSRGVTRIGSGAEGADIDALRALFGGVLTDCTELGENYYLCCFTRQLAEEAPGS